MSNFNYEVDDIMDEVNEGKPRPRFNQMKLDKEVSHVVLLPAVEGRKFMMTTAIHELWANGKPIFKVASPSFEKEPDPIMDFGFKLKKKFDGSKNSKLRDLYKLFMPKREKYVNVIDYTDIAAGPKVLKMPHSILKVVKAELEEADDIKDYIGFDSKILKIKHNGGKKTDKEYVLVKFVDKRANLIEGGHIDEEEIVSKLVDLSILQPEQDPKSLAKLFLTLKQKAKRVIDEAGEDLEDSDGVESKDADAVDEDFDLA
jgi:hypothetical protein